MNTTGPFFLVRKVGTDEYETGYGKYAVPKLYTKGSATNLKNKRNKFAEEHGLSARYEVVPVEFKFTGAKGLKMTGDPKNPKPGDKFEVKVGSKVYDTVIDEYGTQRFEINGPVNALVDHQHAMFEEYWMKQRIPNHPCVYSLNEIAVDFQKGKWSLDEQIHFYTMFGYSVSGFSGLSFVEDVEIINPLWE